MTIHKQFGFLLSIAGLAALLACGGENPEEAANGPGAGIPTPKPPPRPSPTPDAPVTFWKDIAPIFQRNCQGCHHPGTAAPMSLMTFEEARPFSKAIEKAVGERTMPPWHADAPPGVFKNDRRLSGDDQRTIFAWIRQGSPAGDPATQPPPLVFPDGWNIGEPDLVLELPEDHILGAEVEDESVTIQLKLPESLTEPKWITAAEARPDNIPVVHHMNAWPAIFVPGVPPTIFPPGYGAMLRPGDKFELVMHYHKERGRVERDRSRIGFKLSSEPMTHKVELRIIELSEFTIPAGDPAFKLVGNYRTHVDWTIMSMQPHMHYRGKSMTYSAISPTGAETILLSVPGYDFNWQTNYELVNPVTVPAGSTLRATAYYDNSANNPNNPDPSKSVNMGLTTTDEMMQVISPVIIYMPPPGKRPNEIPDVPTPIP